MDTPSFINKVTGLFRPKPGVKETDQVLLEYDPRTRRKVLNTYEILREIGKGEHGKVKLAKDLVHHELVAIKVVDRRPKGRPRLRKGSDHEYKIRREIAIMKKCHHKHVVKLREVLDDTNTNKIYLVLEYLEKGEIRWKQTRPEDDSKQRPDDDLPCRNSLEDDSNLLSNDFSPCLTFRQVRSILRDVVSGLEYLHSQGVVHRDIKPANLLVSGDNVVKISDFGVSFASSLEGIEVSPLELAKTAGTPAFFAPEMCQMNFADTEREGETKKEREKEGETKKEREKEGETKNGKIEKENGNTENGEISENSITNRNSLRNSYSMHSCHILSTQETCEISPSKVDHRIDIWALGVTLYCLLFGRVPFNAETEFELFRVICTQPVEFPTSASSFNSPAPVREDEFVLAKDLVSAMLAKDPDQRISIAGIKSHPFTTMDLEGEEFSACVPDSGPDTILGFGSRIKKSLMSAMRMDDDDSSVILSEERAPSRSSSYSLRGRIIDDSQSRRGSSTEAPQIETKRNVEGDLYMKNQTAVDAFKGLQKADARRRSSSIFSFERRKEKIDKGNKGNDTNEESENDNETECIPIKSEAVPSTPHSTPKLKVGPISIANDARRKSSVMSLPFSNSFASLDSFNDDYLEQKYQEFSQRKKEHAHLFDSDPSNNSSFDPSITAKFKAFDLNSQMRVRINPESTKRRTFEGIPPRRLSSSSSSSEDEPDLTLAFSSRVKSRTMTPDVDVRPPLNPSSRAKSHDSDLPRLSTHQHTNSDGAVPTFNVLFGEDVPELADIPDGLISDVPRMSVSGVPSLVYGQRPGSSATLTATGMEISDSAATIKEKKRMVSPLLHNAPVAELATVNAQGVVRNGGVRPAYQRSNSVTLGILSSGHRIERNNIERANIERSEML